MRISVIQTKRRFQYDPVASPDFDLKTCLELSKQEMEEGFQLVEKAGQQGAQLVATIEGFNESLSIHDPRYDFMDYMEPLDGPAVARFSAVAKQYRTYIVAGLYTRREGKAYNSALLCGTDGQIVGIYDKVHMPYNNNQYFFPGNSYPVFETEHGNIAMLICWDMQYPKAVREVALGGADLIACPTQGWEPIYGYCRPTKTPYPSPLPCTSPRSEINGRTATQAAS